MTGQHHTTPGHDRSQACIESGAGLRRRYRNRAEDVAGSVLVGPDADLAGKSVPTAYEEEPRAALGEQAHALKKSVQDFLTTVRSAA
jgi:hypothetical protein